MRRITLRSSPSWNCKEAGYETKKNLTGLRAGIYREAQSTRGQTLLELLSPS